MPSPLQSLIASGTKLWLDSIDPALVRESRAIGATGATSNPIIVSELIKSGRFDDRIAEFLAAGGDDEAIAWAMTDYLVSEAQKVFEPVWEQTAGNDGYVSFELDPLLEDEKLGPPNEQRIARYIELGKKWSAGHRNRMIKVPATAAGLAALEEMAAAGITLNVTLIFSERQYSAACQGVWRGAQKRDNLDGFKSVYSIFVSRVDVYTDKHVPDLDAQAQGRVGILNAKRIWQLNQTFWQDKNLKLDQEIVFASTGTKKPDDPKDMYVQAFAGSDIETNPPATNEAIEAGSKTYTRQVDQFPEPQIIQQIDTHVDWRHLEETLMSEGLRKFADPQKALLELIAEKRTVLAK